VAHPRGLPGFFHASGGSGCTWASVEQCKIAHCYALQPDSTISSRSSLQDSSRERHFRASAYTSSSSSGLLLSPEDLKLVDRVRLLKDWGFDVWSYSIDELKLFIINMFADLGLFKRFVINQDKFRSFLNDVAAAYRDNPYHNFRHCFDVTHACFLILHLAGVRRHFSSLEVLALMFSCLVHDIDHPGLNNTYQVSLGELVTLRAADCLAPARFPPCRNSHCASTTSQSWRIITASLDSACSSRRATISCPSLSRTTFGACGS
jgi:hypothetical protein